MQLRHDIISVFVVRPAVTQPGHEFLQLRRRPGDFMGGTWQPVSGKIEDGETAVQAALRELREESGLIPFEFYQLDQVQVFYIASQDTAFHCVQFCAIVRADDAVHLNEEHDALRWICPSDAKDNFMWTGDLHAVEEIQRQILSDGLAKQYMRIKIDGV